MKMRRVAVMKTELTEASGSFELHACVSTAGARYISTLCVFSIDYRPHDLYNMCVFSVFDDDS